MPISPLLRGHPRTSPQRGVSTSKMILAGAPVSWQFGPCPRSLWCGASLPQLRRRRVCRHSSQARYRRHGRNPCPVRSPLQFDSSADLSQRLSDTPLDIGRGPADATVLAAALVVGCWPWASLCLLIHLLRAPWDAGRGFIPFLGVLAMVKAYAGGRFEPFFVA